jgi:hypothetical protein
MEPSAPANRAAEDHDFLFFSREYAQAVDAFAAIRKQASTLVTLGSTAELDGFLGQFIAMAETTAGAASAEHLANFPEWFAELVRKAEELRRSLRQG